VSGHGEPITQGEPCHVCDAQFSVFSL
jgi:hypothetical protein